MSKDKQDQKEDDKSYVVLNGPKSKQPKQQDVNDAKNKKQTQIDFGTFPKHLMDLIYWKDSFWSASVLSICMTLWFLIDFMDRTVLSLLSYITVFMICVSLIYMNGLFIYTSYYASKSSIPKEFKLPQPSFDCMDDETAKYIIQNIRLFVNSSYFYCSYIICCTSNKHTFMVLLIACFTSFIGEWISGITIIMFIIIILFTVPYFYKNNKDAIHAYSTPLIGIFYTILLKISQIIIRILTNGKDQNRAKDPKKKE